MRKRDTTHKASLAVYTDMLNDTAKIDHARTKSTIPPEQLSRRANQSVAADLHDYLWFHGGSRSTLNISHEARQSVPRPRPPITVKLVTTAGPVTALPLTGSARRFTSSSASYHCTGCSSCSSSSRHLPVVGLCAVVGSVRAFLIVISRGGAPEECGRLRGARF